MAILGISSATKTISVGLCEDKNILSEFTLSKQSTSTEDLIIYIDQITNKNQTKISGIAVAIGPGSYSGLRGGLATAKTLAQVLSVPIVGVSTLEAIAFNLLPIDGTIIALTDARRDEFNFAIFTSFNNNIKRITQDLVINEDKILRLLSKFEGIAYVCCIISNLQEKLLKLNPEAKVKFVGQSLSLPYGKNVALIGEDLILKGKITPLMQLNPKYSVEPNIKEFKTS